MLLDHKEKLCFNQNWILNHLNKEKIPYKLLEIESSNKCVLNVLKFIGIDIELKSNLNCTEIEDEHSILEDVVVIDKYLKFE